MNDVKLGCSKGHAVREYLAEGEVKRAHLPVRITREEALRVLLAAVDQWIALFTLAWDGEIWKRVQKVELSLLDSSNGGVEVAVLEFLGELTVYCFVDFLLGSFVVEVAEAPYLVVGDYFVLLASSQDYFGRQVGI